MIAGLEHARQRPDRSDDEEHTFSDGAGTAAGIRLPALRAVPPHERPAERRLRPRGSEGRRRPTSASGSTSCSSWSSWRRSRSGYRISSRAANVSASRSPERWPRDPRSCCSTSRSARSTPASARSSVAGWTTCTASWASPACSSRTTRRRRSSSPTDRRDASGPRRADRRARGDLQPPGHAVRRRVRRRGERDHGFRERRPPGLRRPPAPWGADHLEEGVPAHAYIRPLDIRIVEPAVANGHSYAAIVERVNDLGPASKIRVRLTDGQPLVAEVPNDDLPGSRRAIASSSICATSRCSRERRTSSRAACRASASTAR